MPNILDDIIASVGEEGSGMKPFVEAPAPEPTPTPTPEPTPAPIVEIPAEPAAPQAPAEPTTIPVAEPVVPIAQVVPAVPVIQIPDAPKAPEFDKAKYLDELSGGEAKSEEDLKKILSEYKQAQQVMQDPNYEYAQKLSAWEKEGKPKELFHAVQTIKADELSVEDKVKLKLKIENPEWTKDDIDLFINDEYKQDKDANSEQSVKVGQLRMQRDAQAFTPELKRMQEMTVIKTDYAAKQRELEQTENTRKDAWKQELPKLVNEFQEVNFSIGKEIYPWKVTKEQSAELLKSLESIVQNAPVQLNEQGIKAIKDVMLKEFYSKNINQIASGISTFTASKKADEHIKEIHNPTGAVQPAGAPVPTKKSGEDQAFDEIVKAEGIQRRR